MANIERARHLMTAYRKYLLASKRKFGSARGLGHYHQLLAAYLAAKREVVRG